MTSQPSLFDPSTPRRAARELAAADPRFAPLIARGGSLRMPPKRRGGSFAYLLRAVVFQQLATAAAQAIHRRVTIGLGDERRVVTPRAILDAGEERLASLGLSGSKRRTLLELSDAIECGRFQPRRLARLPDEEVIGEISSLFGFGRWSAEMFLIFYLGRPDVLPATDLAIRASVAQLAAEEIERWPAKRVLERGACWAPWRSAAAWWLWRARSTAIPGDDGLGAAVKEKQR